MILTGSPNFFVSMNVIVNLRAEISPVTCQKRAKIKSVFQVSMSQAVSPDPEPSPDLTSAPAGPLQQDTDSCQDIPALLESASSPLSLIHHESTGEMSTGDTCTGETAEATNQTEMEAGAERQLTECDQPVSLDPESTEDVEVCNITRDVLYTCCCKQNQILSCFALHKALEAEPFRSLCMFQHAQTKDSILLETC